MTQDYETVVRESFNRLSTEELIQRRRGDLTPEAVRVLDQVLMQRNVSPEDFSTILRAAENEDALLTSLPNGVTEANLASPWIRLLAHIIDHFVAVIIMIVFVFNSDALAWIGILGYLTYYLLSDALPGGKSIGKRLLGIKVVAFQDLSPCSIGRALKRNLIMMIPIIGFLDMFSIFGRNKQRWGDRWAKTLVIKAK
jgi:uncharacterized RDD family membrane protein YckC